MGASCAEARVARGPKKMAVARTAAIIIPGSFKVFSIVDAANVMTKGAR
jgi:hypothetical protein